MTQRRMTTPVPAEEPHLIKCHLPTTVGLALVAALVVIGAAGCDSVSAPSGAPSASPSATSSPTPRTPTASELDADDVERYLRPIFLSIDDASERYETAYLVELGLGICRGLDETAGDVNAVLDEQIAKHEGTADPELIAIALGAAVGSFCP